MESSVRKRRLCRNTYKSLWGTRKGPRKIEFSQNHKLREYCSMFDWEWGKVGVVFSVARSLTLLILIWLRIMVLFPDQYILGKRIEKEVILFHCLRVNWIISICWPWVIDTRLISLKGFLYNKQKVKANHLRYMRARGLFPMFWQVTI